MADLGHKVSCSGVCVLIITWAHRELGLYYVDTTGWWMRNSAVLVFSPRHFHMTRAEMYGTSEFASAR